MYRFVGGPRAGTLLLPQGGGEGLPEEKMAIG